MELGQILKAVDSKQVFMVVHVQINHDRSTEYVDNRDWFRVINLTDANGQPTQEYHMAQYHSEDAAEYFTA